MKIFSFRNSLILLLLYLAAMSVYFWNKQYYNWDIEAYMGIIYTLDNPEIPIAEIHDKVYSELKTEAPHTFEFPDVEEKTIGVNDYYKVLASNPDAYGEELELFKVKPLYNWINFAFYKLGFSPSKATAIPVILPFVLIVLGIFLFTAKQWKNAGLALAVAVLVSLFKPLQDATRHASPDMLAAVLLLAAFYHLFYTKNSVAYTVFAMLTVFARPEFMLLFAIFSVLKVGFERSLKQNRELLTALLFIVASFGIIQLSNQVSWQTLVMNQFIKVQYFPVSAPEVFDETAYLNYLKQNILLEFNSSYFVILLLFAALIFAPALFLKRHLTAAELSRILLIVAIYITVMVRFFVFPMLVNRMMVGFYLLIILILIAQQRKSVSLQQ